MGSKERDRLYRYAAGVGGSSEPAEVASAETEYERGYADGYADGYRAALADAKVRPPEGKPRMAPLKARPEQP